MTDKVQKIREEVERLQNELIQEKKNGFGSDVDDACILELQNVLTYIDSLQEEPVSEDLEEALEEFIDSIMGHIEFNSATPFTAEYVVKLLEEAFKAGAQWQKEHSFSDSQINENIIYAKGYKQAEKDNALTWEDISIIRKIMYDYNKQVRNEMAIPKEEEYCKEVLKRFLEQKGGDV